jgi:sarcosine oxidase
VTPPETHRLDGSVRYDAAIIGAGFTGLRAALALSLAGTEVAVLEADEIGFGASGRTGGQVNLGYHLDPDEIERVMGPDVGSRMVRAAAALNDEVFALIQRHGLRCDAVQKGWLKAAHCHAALRHQERQAEQWERRGVTLEILDGAEVERRSGARGYRGGFFFPKGGSLQPLSYTRELARAAIERGAKIYEKTPALKLTREGAVWRIETPKGSLSAERVLIGTNGYSDRLWPGLARSLVPIRSVQAATEPLPEEIRARVLPNGNTLSDTRRILYYCRLDRDHRLCFGGLGPMRDVFHPSDFEEVKKGARRLFPSLRGIRWDFHWGGRIAKTQDQLPHLHEPAPGLLVGLGYNGRGVGMATLMGRVLAERALGKDAKELPFAATPITGYPLYGLRNAGFKMIVPWMLLRDRLDRLVG